ncbi:MAG: hypothetical protein JW958_08525 [Candidatus Eisenbacteria bacterium]|nr:hypothetical protein [Candidatus Eisenbacteria bacterium]
MRNPWFLIPCGVFLSLSWEGLAGADVRDFAVEVSAVVQESPPRIDFSWRADPGADSIYVFRKEVSDTAWGDPIAVLGGGDSAFTDTEVAVGEAREYSFRKTLGFYADTVEVEAGHSLLFRIYDSWSDGCCCHHGLGSYTVKGCDSVYATGGSFGASTGAAFTAGCDTILVSGVLDAFPAETTWNLTDQTTGDTLARGGPYEPARFGHIFAGIGCPAIEDRGSLLLLAEAGVADSLPAEIARLETDLIADGFRVRKHVIDASYDVPDVKDLIVAEHALDPTIETVFLLGHLPVPYSGNEKGVHTDHQGAWPADLFYGELDGEWTDSYVYNTSASRAANHNIPGDGKYDQTFLPSDVDLMVGRVDLSDLPAFAENEYALMRRYLDKNHDYRTGAFDVERRGIVDDNVGVSGGLAFAAIGWRNIAAQVGTESVVAAPYFATLGGGSYQWSYGCGGSQYTSVGGIGTTWDFAANPVYSVFTMLYGSYFGDWDNRNNVLRAPLASEGHVLTNGYAGRPGWHLHHMALGYTIGYAARLSQNNNDLYTVSDGTRQIHTALMGDPTLKAHIVNPPRNLGVAPTGDCGMRLAWSSSGEAVEGYHVYRAPTLHGAFERLDVSLVTDTVFVDDDPLEENNVYMVRALKEETSAGGTYDNLSAGIIDSSSMATSIDGGEVPRETRLGANIPNPFNPVTTIPFTLAGRSRVRLEVFDPRGRRVRLIADGVFPPGEHGVLWNGRDAAGRAVPSGVYLYRLVSEGRIQTRKMTLLR